MNIIKLYLVLLFITAGTVILQSQSTDTDTSYLETGTNLMEITFNLNKPVGTFNNAVDKLLYGATVAFYAQRDAERYSFYGVDITYAHLGSLTNTITSTFDPFEDRTATNFISTQFVYRYYTSFYLASLEPFVEARLGPHIFYTSTSTTFLDGSDETDFVFEETDFGLSYSVAVGASIDFGSSFLGLVKLGYSGGTATTYMTPSESIIQEYPIDNFSKVSSALNYLTANFGIAFSF